MLRETLDQKKRRLFGKQFLQNYLKLIEKITNNSEITLLSIVDTDRIIEKMSSLNKVFKTVIPFEDKLELKKVIIEKFNSKDRVYLITSLSRDCGGIGFNSISNFNFNFDYKDDSIGIFSLVSEDLKERILLDFYEENDIRFIEIEYYQ